MKFPRLILAAVALVAAPLAMAATTPPDSGLLITRTNSQQWEIRLMSWQPGPAVQRGHRIRPAVHGREPHEA